MKTLTVQELQEKFEYYLDRVETGESFLIKSQYGDAMLIPYNNGEEEIDDLIRIHTDHEEGC
jgi:antitoxin (DNA-binding transcriptional repressor) of toxin-antitoxin stability system